MTTGPATPPPGGGPGGAMIAPLPGAEITGAPWRVIWLDGRDLPEPAPTMAFRADGEVQGTGGCNSYGAAYGLSGMSLTIGPARTTRMGCPEDVMAIEADFHAALAAVAEQTIGGNGRLYLSSATGRTLIVGERIE